MEQERDSLRTLVEELKADKNKHFKWQVVESKTKTKTIAPTRKKSPNTTTIAADNLLTVLSQVPNQYAALDDEGVDRDTTIEDKEKHIEERATNKHRKHGTIVMGDSILKGLRQHTISKATKSKVQIKCFPGAKLQDMKHYSVPPLSASKPKNIILHAGTNDLHCQSSTDIAKETGELCIQIQNTCPDAEIVISSIITRNDDENGSKVFEVNNLLKQLCEKNNYRFLANDNIDRRCLNRSGLHLNKYGDSKLANNIIAVIKGV